MRCTYSDVVAAGEEVVYPGVGPVGKTRTWYGYPWAICPPLHHGPGPGMAVVLAWLWSWPGCGPGFGAGPALVRVRLWCRTDSVASGAGLTVWLVVQE